MSESTPRLNLIQRAMQQANLRRATAEELPDIEEERREPTMEVRERPIEREVPAPKPEAVMERRQPEPVVERREAPPPPPPRRSAYADAAPSRTAMPAGGLRLNLNKLRESRMVTPDNRASVTYNEFRAIKRKLLPMMRDPATKATTKNIVMITSALAGEGKTYTAMNLAIGLAAERNLEVILVDGDVVRSSIAQYFEGAPEEGLLDLLTGRRQQIDEVLQRCADLPNLHVLFSGRRDDSSPELLASARMAEICSALSRRFKESVVVIDAPPVLATAEPSALAMHVHHLIMVVAAGQVARHHVEEALAGVACCPSINLVFNKSPEWQRATPYPYYYNYAEK
jgi:receptor protein-tyrosine kinase